MVSGIIDIIVGFIIGIIQNSNWFQNLFTNKIYNSLIQGSNRKIKNVDDTLESFYKELYQKKKSYFYASIDTLIINAVIIFIIVGIVISLLNAFTSPIKIGSITIPQWGLFIIGYILGLVYKIISTKFKNQKASINY